MKLHVKQMLDVNSKDPIIRTVY
ncbi:hypothetical protein BOH78_3210 [Pichia kudriavzevii]|uniref:Uncharacterized protein n=2 Tax=Pichia kudriavzevii TaxID=4909 RepID=A0A1V2LKC4_PICKU|nr:hypothetical protein BOH78_3210 [Pichia kudriavzevii]